MLLTTTPSLSLRMDVKALPPTTNILSNIPPILPPPPHSRTSLESEFSTLPPAYSGTSVTPALVPRSANITPTEPLPTSPRRPPPELWVNAHTTSLHQAILAADLQLVQEHLNAGTSANLTDGASMTALHLACSQPSPPSPDLIDLLLQRGAKPNAIDKEEWTPLLHATHQGHTLAVLKLLEHGTNVTVKTNTGSTALHLVDQVEIADALLRSGADPNSLDNLARSPLLLASSRGNISVVRTLLKNGAEPEVTDTYIAGALTHCILGSDSPDLIRLLLLNGAKLNVVDTYGYTPLHHAAAYDRCDTTILLLESGADIAPAASWLGWPYPKKVAQPHMEALLDRQGGRVNYGGGMTPLHVAAYAGSASTLALLLEKGQAQVDQRSRRGMTALHYCSQSHISADYVQIAQVLVKYGADVNAKGEENLRPLHSAAAVGRTTLVEYLVEQGAEVGAMTKSGMTPAKLARVSGDKGLGSWLKERDRRSLLRRMKDGLIYPLRS